MDGEITSEVDGTELPTENDQSNFGTGYAYQRGRENYVIVMMDGEPEIFQNIEMESDGSIPSEVLHFNGEVKEIGDGNLLVTYLSTADGFMELSDGGTGRRCGDHLVWWDHSGDCTRAADKCIPD